MAHKSDPCPLCLAVFGMDKVRIVHAGVRDARDGVVVECPSCSLQFFARGRADKRFIGTTISGCMRRLRKKLSGFQMSLGVLSF